MVCSNCGYALGPDDQFCGGCGAYLTDAPEEEATPTKDDWVIPYAQSPAEPSPRRDSGAGRTTGIAVAVIAALFVVGLALFAILGGGDDDTQAADPAPTTPAATATATDEPTSSPEPTTDQATEPTEDPTTPEPEPTSIELPGAAAQCTNVGSLGVYRGNDQTSCPFAENVARAFAALDQPVTSAVTLEGVTSPVTGQSYTLECDHSLPVRCTGGNNAVIYLQPSS